MNTQTVSRRGRRVAFCERTRVLNRGLRLIVVPILLGAASFPLITTSPAAAVTGPGYTCSPSGNKGCFAQVNGAYDIRDFTWNSGDTQKVDMFAFSFSSSDSLVWFEQWRNRLATGSRALYLTDNISIGAACARLVYDTRTWVLAPPASANYARSTANSPSTGIYGTCYNA